MAITAYIYPKCGTCRNAVKWLRSHGHEVNEIHIVEQTPSAEVLRELVDKSGLELKKWFNVSGNVYRELGLKDKLPNMEVDEQLELLSSNGMLIKRPVVTDGKQVTIGYKEEQYEQAWGSVT